MTPPFLADTSRPSAPEIASAYLRIGHIYRRGGLCHLAIEYYRLVTARFAARPDIARPARRFLARTLGAVGDHAGARREWRALLRDRGVPPAMACRAALELLRTGRTPLRPGRVETLRWLLGRRLERVLGPRRFRRWQQLAARELNAAATPARTRRASG
ncbi:MAG: hypothetical protein JXQ29_11385 [Planctomycetes bacterium]|nr:hypothetical protein [Planctomycetota bacterium]